MRMEEARGLAWLIEAHKVGHTMLESKPSKHCGKCRGHGLFFGTSSACVRSMAAHGVPVVFPREFDGGIVRDQNLSFRSFNDSACIRVTTCRCSGRVHRFDVPHTPKVERVAMSRFGGVRG